MPDLALRGGHKTSQGASIATMGSWIFTLVLECETPGLNLIFIIGNTTVSHITIANKTLGIDYHSLTSELQVGLTPR